MQSKWSFRVHPKLFYETNKTKSVRGNKADIRIATILGLRATETVWGLTEKRTVSSITISFRRREFVC